MATIPNHADEFRWAHEYVSGLYGASVANSSPYDRATNAATHILFGALVKLLADKGLVTNADLEDMIQGAIESTVVPVPFDPQNDIGIRYNKVSNPALAVDTSGWSNVGGTGTQTAASGFPRSNVYRVTNAAIVECPLVAVVEGEVWTYSIWYQRSVAGGTTVDAHVQFYNGATPTSSSLITQWTVSAATPTRLHKTVTIPDNSDGMELIVTSSYAPGPNDHTCALAERHETLMDYFDGDTSGAVWDGTAGASTSTWDTT